MAIILIVGTVIAFFFVRITSYPNLLGNERRIGAYVLDVLQNGNWIVQKDSTGEIASKPPLLTWCVALAASFTSRLTQWTLYLPTAISTAAVALVLFFAGRNVFGWRAAFLAAWAYVVSPVGYAQVATVRYDGLLALPVTLAAVAGFRAWINGTSWTWFWASAAIGTLVKGPIALVLAALGFLAAFWERRTGKSAPFRGSHWFGLIVFLMISGGWFALAYRQLGPPLIAKMIGRELIGHATGSGSESFLMAGFIEPPIDFLTGFAPWSLLSIRAFWRMYKRPAGEAIARRLERFLVCGFIFGLLLFCFAAHHRSRLIFPLIPMAALLTGRELANLTQSWSNRRLFKTSAGLSAIVLIGIFVHGHFLLRYSSKVQETLAMQQLADSILQQLGADAPLTHVDSHFALQLYLNTYRPTVSFERAAALLKGDAAAWVAVRNFAKLKEQLGPSAQRLYEVARWPETGSDTTHIVGNRPLPMVAGQPTALLLGPLRIEAKSLRLEQPRLAQLSGIQLTFRGNVAQGQLHIKNEASSPQPIRVQIFDASARMPALDQKRLLLPGEVWQFPQKPSSADR